MIRRILTPLDNSEYTETAIAYTCQIAKKFDSEVAGMVVLDAQDIDDSVGPIAPGGLELAEKLERKKELETEKHIKHLLQNLSEKCAEEGVKHIEEEFQGSPSERIIEESKFYDLVIMGLRTFYYYGTKDETEKTLDEILNHTITPVLAVPKKYRELKNVLIVCDGELPSVRAMQRFSHMIIDENIKITLLHENKDERKAKYNLDNAEKYLRTYGVKNIEKVWVEKKLLNEIYERFFDEIDLIVIGLHSHKSLKEFLLGDVAHSLILDGRRALFLAQ